MPDIRISRKPFYRHGRKRYISDSCTYLCWIVESEEVFLRGKFILKLRVSESTKRMDLVLCTVEIQNRPQERESLLLQTQQST